MPTPRRIVVTAAQAGMRLDVLLRQQLHLGRSTVEQLLAGGHVAVDDRTVSRKGLRVEAGQVVEIVEPALGDVLAPQPELPLTVLAEGEGWVAIDKPAGQNVHPLEVGETGTLLNAAIARYPEMIGVGEAGLRSGVVHRLDQPTSGCLVLARSQAMWDRLRSAFKEHRTTKVYRAIVAGALHGEGRQVVCLKITQHKPARVRVVAPEPGLWRCDLRWRAIEHFPSSNATLIEVQLGTGFLHQIRATFAHTGHPLLGDTLYGGPPLAPRVMLHAASLQVEGIAAHAPDPLDFQQCLQRLRSPFPAGES